MTLHKTTSALLLGLVVLLASSAAHAAPIYSQTPTVNTGVGSDLAFFNRAADEFSLTPSATARSVTWRGVSVASNTPEFPMSFDLTLYADAAGVPGAVLSTTTVSLTGVDTGQDFADSDVYEFQANLTPTALSAATTYWFSPFTDTTADVDDAWSWVGDFSAGSLATAAINGPWGAMAGTSYFILDDQALATGGPGAVPEPTTAMLTLATLAGLALRRRRTA